MHPSPTTDGYMTVNGESQSFAVPAKTSGLTREVGGLAVY